jgi:hypothetical protein
MTVEKWLLTHQRCQWLISKLDQQQEEFLRNMGHSNDVTHILLKLNPLKW